MCVLVIMSLYCLYGRIQTLEMLQSLKTEEVNTIEKKCLQ